MGSCSVAVTPRESWEVPWWGLQVARAQDLCRDTRGGGIKSGEMPVGRGFQRGAAVHTASPGKA